MHAARNTRIERKPTYPHRQSRQPAVRDLGKPFKLKPGTLHNAAQNGITAHYSRRSSRHPHRERKNIANSVCTRNESQAACQLQPLRSLYPRCFSLSFRRRFSALR